MNQKRCLSCNKPVFGSHNKKYCGRQDLRGSCSNKAMIANIKRLKKPRNKTKKDIKFKIQPCLMCGKDIQVKGSTKYCGNQRTPGSCSYINNNKQKNTKEINLKTPDTKLTVNEPKYLEGLTPRQQRIAEIGRHNLKAVRLRIRKD